MRHIIAVDIGTTHTKACIVTENGRFIFSCREENISITDHGGRHEQDANKIFLAVVKLIKECLQQIREKDIACISFSAAMHSLLAVDVNGKPMMPAMTWADVRAQKFSNEYKHTHKGEKIYMQTGTPVYAGMPVYKLMWLKKSRPHIYKSAAKFVSIKEYVFYKFFGEYVVDESIASATGLYNFKKRKWLNIVDNKKLSKVVSTSHTLANMLPQMRKKLSLQKNIPFVIGASDGALANLGAHALTKDKAVVTLGTSGAVRVSVDAASPFKANGLFRYVITEDLHIAGGPVNNGGIVLKWFADLFLSEKEKKGDYVQYILELAEKASWQSQIIFMPYLLGERAPIWNESAGGVFFNLNANDKREDIARAVLHGITFSLFHVMEKIDTSTHKSKTITVNGIISKSNWWMQLLANICNRPVIFTETADASCMGAAYLGMYATGIINKISDIEKFEKPGKKFMPQKNETMKLNVMFQQYKRIYQKLKHEF